MEVLIVYDVQARRVASVCSYLRTHLVWVQRSVFEGRLTAGQLAELRHTLMKLIHPRTDSVYIYTVQRGRFTREVLGRAPLSLAAQEQQPHPQHRAWIV